MSTSQIIAQIGQKYSTSLLTGGGFSKTSLSLFTDQLAGGGKSYTLTANKNVSFIAPLKAVSSVGLDYSSYYILLILGIIVLLVSVVTFWPAAVLGILLIIAYIKIKQRYIVVNVHGFAYALSLRGISNQEVTDFMEAVTQAINTAKGM